MKVSTIFLLLLIFSSTQTFPQQIQTASKLDTTTEKYLKLIDTISIRKHLYALAHDSMMGRRPGTVGEALTTQYLSKAFRDAGLTPAYNNTYLQPVPLLHASSTGTLSVKNGNSLTSFTDSSLLIRSNKSGSLHLSNTSLVFVGYGITAPEFRWDDYKGIDVKGKIVVVLDGEPQQLIRRNFADTGTLTYHWLFFVKQEMAKQHGAKGVILLSEWNRFLLPKWWWQQDFALLANDLSPLEPDIFAWLLKDASAEFTKACNTTLKKAQEQANDSNFIPVSLPVQANFSISTKTIPFTSYNVVGYIKGSDPELSKECIVYSTHWDGLGTGTAQQEDSIYNAAKDNAGGIAEMITIAHTMHAMVNPPRRSVVFIASTAEESGILGAEAYVRSPLFPLKKTVLAICMDIFSPWGHVTKLINQGYGYTTLDSLLSSLAQKRGIPYSGPQNISLYAGSDHYRFALRGVPAVFAEVESESLSLSKKTIDSIEAASRAHTPFDEIFPGWNLQSAAEEAKILFELGVTVANTFTPPRWTVNSQFNYSRKK